jgi:hypothetical protein
MGTTQATPEIDLGAIQDEISKLSKDDLASELLKARVRQKKQQKKQQGSGAQKAYQMKQRERMKLLKAEAIKLGLWDKINEDAETKAEEELAAETVDGEA